METNNKKRASKKQDAEVKQDALNAQEATQEASQEATQEATGIKVADLLSSANIAKIQSSVSNSSNPKFGAYLEKLADSGIICRSFDRRQNRFAKDRYYFVLDAEDEKAAPYYNFRYKLLTWLHERNFTVENYEFATQVTEQRVYLTISRKQATADLETFELPA